MPVFVPTFFAVWGKATFNGKFQTSASIRFICSWILVFMPFLWKSVKGEWSKWCVAYTQ